MRTGLLEIDVGLGTQENNFMRIGLWLRLGLGDTVNSQMCPCVYVNTRFLYL